MPGISSSALTDYGSLTDFSPEWFVAVPAERQDVTVPQLREHKPQRFMALAGMEHWVRACVADVPLKCVWGIP